MTEIKARNKIDFSPITKDDRQLFVDSLGESGKRGCEVSFANLYLWGDQRFAIIDGVIVILSKFGDRYVYSYPLGKGDKKSSIDSIINDSKERGIPCRMTGLTSEDVSYLNENYPNKFRFHTSEDSYDYVYDINDLADLKGKKYHGKRNHLNRFKEMYPDYRVEPISDENKSRVKAMAKDWYRDKSALDPDGDYTLEEEALYRAIDRCNELEMETMVLINGDEIMGFTLGSLMYDDTFDIHFEKALSNVQGAYAVINWEFSKYLRDKYPHIKYLDREEDMGIEGLRKAKKSYYPLYMVEKYTAILEE